MGAATRQTSGRAREKGPSPRDLAKKYINEWGGMEDEQEMLEDDESWSKPRSRAQRSNMSNPDRMLLISLAHHVLYLSAQVRILRAINIIVLILWRSAEPSTSIKAAQKSHAESVVDLGCTARLSVGRRPVLSWNAWMTWFEKATTEKGDAPMAEAIQLYRQDVAANAGGNTPQAVSEHLSTDIRVFNLTRCYQEAICKLEVCIRPNSKSSVLWSMALPRLLESKVAERRNGYTPRMKAEADIEK